MFDEIVDPCVIACNSMLDACGRNGEMDSDIELFQRTPVTDVVSWTIVIKGFGKNELHAKAVMVFGEMIENRHVLLITPNEATFFVCDLDQRSVRLGKQIHGYVMRIKIILTTTLGTTLLDMYGKAGHFDMALTIFHQIWIKIYTRNAIISALASNGRPEKALEMFEMMKSKNVHPNGITLLAVLTAYARSKLVHLGYPAVHFPYVVSTRSLQHQSITVCMVDLIDRAGVLVEVVSFIKNGSFIKNLPFKPNASVLEALLGACKIHEDVELDNKVGKWLIGLQPQHCGQYVALSTLNAMKSNWAEAEQMRKVIIKAGIRIIPAQSVRCFKA